MLDISSAGMDLLLRVQSRVAENCDDADTFDEVDTTIEALKQMVGKTQLRRALSATSESSQDQIRRERDVLRALTETLTIKRMQ